MGRSSPTRHLYCSRCKAKHFRAAVCGSPKHFNVVVDSGDASGNAQCRCLTCGHTYVSRSRAGRRQVARGMPNNCYSTDLS